MRLRSFRNNLTVMDVVVLEGRGALEHLRVVGRTPGREGYLRFKVTEAQLRHCTNREFYSLRVSDREFTVHLE